METNTCGEMNAEQDEEAVMYDADRYRLYKKKSCGWETLSLHCMPRYSQVRKDGAEETKDAAHACQCLVAVGNGTSGIPQTASRRTQRPSSQPTQEKSLTKQTNQQLTPTTIFLPIKSPPPAFSSSFTTHLVPHAPTPQGGVSSNSGFRSPGQLPFWPLTGAGRTYFCILLETLS